MTCNHELNVFARSVQMLLVPQAESDMHAVLENKHTTPKTPHSVRSLEMEEIQLTSAPEYAVDGWVHFGKGHFTIQVHPPKARSFFFHPLRCCLVVKGERMT